MRAKDFWAGIDALSDALGVSPAGLAKRSGLDSGVFSPARRREASGGTRWPRLAHIAAVCHSAGLSLGEFLGYMYDDPGRRAGFRMPVTSIARASDPEAFDSQGYARAKDWNVIDFPDLHDPNAFALQVNDDIYAPIYPNGTVLVCAPDDRVVIGNRVLVNHVEEGLFIGTLLRQTPFLVTVERLPDDEAVEEPATQIEWMARIAWVRQ